MRPLARLAVNLALAAASAGLFLGSAELVCRLTEKRQPPPAMPTAAYITEWMEGGDAFFTVKSTAVGWPPWEDYNHDGVRDREHATAKPKGTRRLVCLGDSVTLGYGIQPREAFPQVLQDLLAARGLPVEVFNISLGGWSTRQELIAYRRLARKYQPDQVILNVCLNDIPEMENNLTRPPAWLMAAHRRSALVRRLVGASDREIHSVEELFTQGDTPKVRDAFAKFEGDVRRLRDEARADGASFALLASPFRFQVLPDAPPPSVQERIGAFCRQESIPFLDLLPALRPLGTEAYFDYDHFSAVGARTVAEAVLRAGLVAGADVAPDSPRVAAVWAAGRRGPAAADQLDALTAALDDGDAALRAGAAWALGQIGPAARPARPALVRRLDDGDESVRWRAGDALDALGVDRACCFSGLTAALGHATSPGRAPAARLLGRLGADARDAVPLLASALQDPREEVRAQAVVALGLVGPAARAALPALVAAFEDATVRWQVADALAAIGPEAPEVQAVLLRGLADPSSSVRWRSATALEAVPVPGAAAVSALTRATADGAENVRLAALKALSKLEAPPLDVYVRALRDPDTRVRVKAVEVLGRIGSASVVPALEGLAADPDPDVRTAASRALRKLKRHA